MHIHVRSYDKIVLIRLKLLQIYACWHDYAPPIMNFDLIHLIGGCITVELGYLVHFLI